MREIIYTGSSAERDNIIACTGMILTTARGTMPYVRDMGIPDDILGKDTPEAADEYLTEAIDQIEAWDARVLVRQIDVAQDENGIIKPKVVLEDNGESY